MRNTCIAPVVWLRLAKPCSLKPFVLIVSISWDWACAIISIPWWTGFKRYWLRGKCTPVFSSNPLSNMWSVATTPSPLSPQLEQCHCPSGVW
eukprot:COSAG01_NODE_12126_length_1797_cov_2.067727_3_plen_92_part_00